MYIHAYYVFIHGGAPELPALLPAGDDADPWGCTTYLTLAFFKEWRIMRQSMVILETAKEVRSPLDGIRLA